MLATLQRYKQQAFNWMQTECWMLTSVFVIRQAGKQTASTSRMLYIGCFNACIMRFSCLFYYRYAQTHTQITSSIRVNVNTNTTCMQIKQERDSVQESLAIHIYCTFGILFDHIQTEWNNDWKLEQCTSSVVWNETVNNVFAH